MRGLSLQGLQCKACTDPAAAPDPFYGCACLPADASNSLWEQLQQQQPWQQVKPLQPVLQQQQLRRRQQQQQQHLHQPRPPNQHREQQHLQRRQQQLQQQLHKQQRRLPSPARQRGASLPLGYPANSEERIKQLAQPKVVSREKYERVCQLTRCVMRCWQITAAG